MSPLVQSLWITLIGMALVFIAILVLWGLITGLVRWTASFVKEEASEDQVEVMPGPESVPAAASDRKKRAAAAAVAIAMALQKPVGRAAAINGSGSAWQTVTRSRQLNQPTHITPKNRGSVR